MSILNIQTGENNPILRNKVEEIKEITPEITGLISDMIESCIDSDGVGLSANQVGKSLNLFIVRIPLAGDEYFIKEFINPKIINISDEVESMEEGCLSLPKFFKKVDRSIKLTLEYQDKSGKKNTIDATDFIARVIQHEMDHLSGILIADK